MDPLIGPTPYGEEDSAPELTSSSSTAHTATYPPGCKRKKPYIEAKHKVDDTIKERELMGYANRANNRLVDSLSRENWQTHHLSTIKS